jgi:hypothetical protein
MLWLNYRQKFPKLNTDWISFWVERLSHSLIVYTFSSDIVIPSFEIRYPKNLTNSYETHICQLLWQDYTGQDV